MSARDAKSLGRNKRIVIGNLTEVHHRAADRLRDDLTRRFDKAIRARVVRNAVRRADFRE
jgi:hypothetical protein